MTHGAADVSEALHGHPPCGIASTDGLGASAPTVRQIGLATLYLGDARHVLRGVRADVVITDPVWPNCPAGLLPGANGMQGALTRLALDILLPVRTAVLVLGFDSDPRWLAEAVPPELPYIRSQQLPYAFPGYRGRLLAGDEMAYVFGGIPAGRGVIPGRARTKTKKKERSAHPCPRQEVHMESLVGWWTLETDIVVDPFMGSGTTGVAAVSAGRQFVGAEIDRAYFDLACERIEQAQQQQTLPLAPNAEVTGVPALSARPVD